MLSTAKVFTTGNSQAIRLPKAFRVDATEMWIVKNDNTGEITLKPKDGALQKRQLEELLAMVRENPFQEDFIPPRDDAPSPDPFAGWVEPAPTAKPVSRSGKTKKSVGTT